MPLILALDNSSRTFRPLTPSQISCHERGSTGCVPHVCLSPTLPVALAEPAGLWCFSLPGQPYFLVSRECCLPFRQCYFFTGGHSQVHQIPQGAEVASPPFLWHRAVLKQCYLWLGILQTFGEAALWVFTVWLPALHQLDMKATEWERMAERFSPRTNPLSYSRSPLHSDNHFCPETESLLSWHEWFPRRLQEPPPELFFRFPHKFTQ